jgi:hypothetical protein
MRAAVATAKLWSARRQRSENLSGRRALILWLCNAHARFQRRLIWKVPAWSTPGHCNGARRHPHLVFHFAATLAEGDPHANGSSPTGTCTARGTSPSVGSPLGCPWLSILPSRVPLSSRGISVVEGVRALARLARGAFSIALVFFPIGRSAFARYQHILGITDLAFCIYPEALRGGSSAAILRFIGVEFD